MDMDLKNNEQSIKSGKLLHWTNFLTYAGGSAFAEHCSLSASTI